MVGVLLVVCVFGAVGYILLKTSHAATPYVSAEAESGALSTPATTVSDATASGGEAVGFAAAAPSDYGGTPGWKVYRTYDLTRDEGWSHTTGVRGTVDSSYNRKEQTTFSSAGMLITAERASDTATIYSSDAQARYAVVPNHFALEADINLGVFLGSGSFPALWLRPSGSGEGEIDIWEYMGNRIGSSLLWKTTLITTPYGSAQRQKEKALPIANAMGMHRWRYEKVQDKVSLWVDGQLLASITKAELDASAGAGKWDAQFESHGWYVRLTYQIGPPRDGGYNAGGPVPAGWRKSTMLTSRLVTYVPQ